MKTFKTKCFCTLTKLTSYWLWWQYMYLNMLGNCNSSFIFVSLIRTVIYRKPVILERKLYYQKKVKIAWNSMGMVKLSIKTKVKKCDKLKACSCSTRASKQEPCVLISKSSLYFSRPLLVHLPLHIQTYDADDIVVFCVPRGENIENDMKWSKLQTPVKIKNGCVLFNVSKLCM